MEKAYIPKIVVIYLYPLFANTDNFNTIDFFLTKIDCRWHTGATCCVLICHSPALCLSYKAFRSSNATDLLPESA